MMLNKMTANQNRLPASSWTLLLSMTMLLLIPVISFGKDKRCIEGDCKDGHGSFEYETGTIYHGDWVNGVEHGHGEMITMDGVYIGSYENGAPHGKGIFKLKSGRTYSGEWEYGMAHGMGEETYSNGSSYKGQWIKGLPNGYGVSTRGGAVDKNGYWIDGEFVGKEKPWNID